MLNLSNLKPSSKRKARKRVGRGSGSGQGTYAGRGLKGQRARSGSSIPPGFEGGRMPLIRQLPKRGGFRSLKVKPQTISLKAIAKAFREGGLVSPKTLRDQGFIESLGREVKIVGQGQLPAKLQFKKVKLSEAARRAAEQAGGRIEN